MTKISLGSKTYQCQWLAQQWAAIRKPQCWRQKRLHFHPPGLYCSQLISSYHTAKKRLRCRAGWKCPALLDKPFCKIYLVCYVAVKQLSAPRSHMRLFCSEKKVCACLETLPLGFTETECCACELNIYCGWQCPVRKSHGIISHRF